MTTKVKQPPFKRGEEVVFVNITDYGLQVSNGTVTAVMDGVVHVKIVYDNGTWTNTYKHKFSTEGHFHRDPYPLWALRKLEPGEDVEKLKKLAAKASQKYRDFKDAWANIEREVERLAWEWKRNELDKRRQDLPDGYQGMMKVAKKMGFKIPKRG